MYESHFGLRESPFVAGHQSKFVYPSREHQEALAHLRYGIENREPFVLITGEVGTGKTTALYDVLHEWQGRAVVALITNSALTRAELIEEIALRFGMPFAGPISKPQAMVQLERHLLSVRARGERAILLLDEAQNLDRTLLEEIRLLSNLEVQGEKLIQVFLVGQPELEDRLARAELRQLRQRIAVHYRLHPLSVEDTERYIHHRLSVAGGYAPALFPADSCREIYRLTHGIPREINTLAGQAMLNAFVEGARSIRPEHVRAAAHETEFRSVIRESGSPLTELHVTPVPEPRDAQSHGPADPGSWDAWLRSLPADAVGDPGDEPEAVDELLDVEIEEERVVEAPAVRPMRQASPPPPAPPPPPPPATPRIVPAPVAAAPPAAPPVQAYAPEPAAPHVRAYAPEPAPEPLRPYPSHEPAPTITLSPRLREKLERAQEEESDDGTSGPGLRRMILIGIAALVLVGGIVAYRFAVWPPLNQGVDAVLGRAPAKPAASTAPVTNPVAVTPVEPPATEATNPAAAGSTSPPPATTRPAETTTRATTPATTTPPRTTARATSPAPRPATTARTAPATVYGLAVGTFLFEDVAAAERTKLATSTGLAGRVEPVRDGSETTFRLVLGRFDSRANAERTASDLIGRGLVDEARVVTVGSATP